MKFTRSSYYVIVFLTLLTLVSVVSMSGCNEKKHVTPPLIGPSAGSGPAGGGDTQRIQLLVSPSEPLEVMETETATVRITALIKNSIGQSMPDGTAVYWNSTNGSLDSVSTTSSNGSTGVTFTFPERYSGCSQVTARSGDATASLRVCVTRVAVTPTPTSAMTPTPIGVSTATPLPHNLIVTANPPTITMPGTSSVTACTSPATSGVAITFFVGAASTGNGTFSPANVTDVTGCTLSTFTATAAGTVFAGASAPNFTVGSAIITIN